MTGSEATREAAAPSRAHLERWAAAGLVCASLSPPSPESLRRVAPWLVATLGERLDLPPLGVITDLGELLLGGALDAKRRAAGGIDDARLVAALRRYEDAVLSRLAADPRLASAGFAVARLPPQMHAQAVGVLAASVLGHLAFSGGVEVRPGLVRTLTERAPVDTIARGRVALMEDAAVRGRLADGYEALVRGAQRARELLSEADVFALENLPVLGLASQRLAIAEVVDAQEALTADLPRRLPRKPRPAGSAATALEDESEYPVGGFSSVSTSGSIENLVSSELIYMDAPGERTGDVDLFDMRYVEGELLYYTRDEAIFVRPRRVITFHLPAALARARVKDAGVRWQRIVLVLGVVLASVKKLSEMLGEEALSMRVVFVDDGGRPSPLGDERGLSELLLQEWRDKGTVEICSGTLEAEDALLEAASRRALVQLVTFGEAPAPAATTRVQRETFAPVHPDLAAWRDALRALFVTLL